MSDKRQWIPIAGLMATIAFAVYVVVQLSAQDAAKPSANFTNATTAEVRDAQGQVLLRGQFALAEEDDDDIERKAVLEPTGIDPDASGEAEVEYTRAAAADQEVEFSVRNLAPGTAVTFVIDGMEVSTATINEKGRAEVDLEVKLPGSK